MPIEIRELVIRATVNAAGGGPAGSGGTPGAGGCGTSPEGAAGAGRNAATSADSDLVQACVREVMRILERNAER